MTSGSKAEVARRSPSDDVATFLSLPSREAAYVILGVRQGASRDEVLLAYRKLLLVFHTDKFAGLNEAMQREAADRMKAINLARSMLGG